MQMQNELIWLSIIASFSPFFPLITGMNATEKLDKDFLTIPVISSFLSPFIVIWSLGNPMTCLFATIGILAINCIDGSLVSILLFKHVIAERRRNKKNSVSNVINIDNNTSDIIDN